MIKFQQNEADITPYSIIIGHLNNSKGKKHGLVDNMGYPLSGKPEFIPSDLETSSYHNVTKSKQEPENISPSPEEPIPKEPEIKTNLLAETSDI